MKRVVSALAVAGVLLGAVGCAGAPVEAPASPSGVPVVFAERELPGILPKMTHFEYVLPGGRVLECLWGTHPSNTAVTGGLWCMPTGETR